MTNLMQTPEMLNLPTFFMAMQQHLINKE